MSSMIELISLALIVIMASQAFAADATLPLQSRSNSLLCLVVQVHVLNVELGERDSLECDLILPEESIVFFGLSIRLPEDVVQQNHLALHRGEWFVQLHGATIETTHVEGYGVVRSGIKLSPGNSSIITIPPGEGEFFLYSVQGRRRQDHSRRLQSTGTRTMLVVRVSTSDASPTYSPYELGQFFFDTNGYSMVQQYERCSMGALRFVPYDFFSKVIDVLVPGQVASFTRELLWSAANAAAAAERDVTSLNVLSQHVAFILPSGTKGRDWIAVGTTGAWRSVYNDIFGGIPNTMVHEIGHNLGLGHASLGSDVYGDTTDLMGYGDFSQFGPSKCFNGVHLWYLQWFADRAIEVDPWTNQLLNLAAFVDYRNTADDHFVVVKVDTMYLVYNRAKGVNNGTEAARDQVTVSLAKPGIASNRLAGLDTTTAPFQVNNFGGGSQSLTIHVCSFVSGPPVDYAIVYISIDGSGCD